jgi:hypothetical protein
MPKLVINDITSGYASTAAINTAFTAVETALEKTLSRDGTAPNQMEANVDLNGYRVLNAGRAISNTDLISLGQFLEYANTDENLIGVIPITWEFISTGASSYPLPLASTDAIDMYIVTSNGLTISPSSYSVSPSTQTLTFLSDVPALSTEIVVRLFGKIPEVSGSGVTINNTKQTLYFTIVGAETVFETSTTLESAATDVYLNGVKLVWVQDYIITGTTVVLLASATAGDVLEVSLYHAIVAPSGSVLAAQTSANAAAVSAAQAAQSVLEAAAAGAAAGAVAGAVGINWLDKAANYTAVTLDGIFADTSAGGFTVTLPLAPSVGHQVYFMDVTSSFDINSLTIGRNAEYIMGLAEDMVVSTANASFRLTYTGAANGWRIG